MLSTFAHLQLSLLLCVVVHLSMYFCTTYRVRIACPMLVCQTRRFVHFCWSRLHDASP